jgi:hypothetical protein
MTSSAEHLYVEEIRKLPRGERLRLAHRILQDLMLEEGASAPTAPSLLDLYGLVPGIVEYGRDLIAGIVE